MATLNILLYSTADTKRLRYEDSDGVMTNEIEKTFMECSYSGHFSPEWVRIEVCTATREALKALEAKYDIYTKRHIRKLYGFIAKLADGEFFYYLNEDATSVVARRTAIDCINAAKAGIGNHLMVHNAAFGHYSELNILFEYLSYGYDGVEEWVGCKDEDSRVCRFCGKMKPDTSFDKVAHAVQDALGNKLLFCYEECDKCNHDLAPVEDNFRKVMDFRRAMYHIPRKDTTKTPKVVGENFIILPDADGLPLLYLMDELLPPAADRSTPFMYRFEHKSTMTNEGMYKALCKMVIDMLPAKELPHFSNTVKWIMGNSIQPDSLPSSLMTVLPVDKAVFRQPVLDIMLNNRGMMPGSPYCTAIIWIYDIAYMFCVPLVDVDAGRYKYDKDLTAHWDIMKSLLGIGTWFLQDMADYYPSIPWAEWDVDLSRPNVFVLPKDNPVFRECLAEREELPDCGLPPYTDAHLSLAAINNVDFTALYNGTITDSDLRDITQHVAGPEFMLYPQAKQVRVRIWVQANDTTDRVEYFRFHFDVTLGVALFEKYIDIVYDNEGCSFAFHYALRNHLFIYALAAAETRMSSLRRDTPFAKCSLDKFLGVKRMFGCAYYLLPTKEDCNRFYKIDDISIHNHSDF